MENRYRRTPKDYDGSAKTTHHIQHLLPQVFHNISKTYHDRPDLILAAWPEIIGEPFAQMTQALSFREGVLTVKVSNSTLHSLLCQYDKPRILKNIRDKFPTTSIKTIVFRQG